MIIWKQMKFKVTIKEEYQIRGIQWIFQIIKFQQKILDMRAANLLGINLNVYICGI